MKLVTGSYIILKVGNKAELAKCTLAEPGKLKAVLEKDRQKEDKAAVSVKFEPEDLMAVLGKRPKVGSVYGQKIEPLVRTLPEVRFWGDVKVFSHFDDEQIKTLKSELDIAYRHLKEKNVTRGFKVNLEIRQPQGSMAGYYKFHPKAEVDTLCVKPDSNFADFQYIIFHEFAHGIWYRQMTPKMRFQWVKLYHNYVKLLELKDKELISIREEVEGAGSLREFTSDADEETKVQLKQILKHISSVHGLNTKHLEMALENGDSLSEYWPTSLEISEKESVITDYARKSPEELWAEVVAHKFVGRKLPKRIAELYEATMKTLVTGGVSTSTKPIKRKSDDDEDAPRTKSKGKKRMKGLR